MANMPASLNEKYRNALQAIDINYHLKHIQELQEIANKLANKPRPDIAYLKLSFDISKYMLDKLVPDPPRDHNVNTQGIIKVNFIGADNNEK